LILANLPFDLILWVWRSGAIEAQERARLADTLEQLRPALKWAASGSPDCPPPTLMAQHANALSDLRCQARLLSLDAGARHFDAVAPRLAEGCLAVDEAAGLLAALEAAVVQLRAQPT